MHASRLKALLSHKASLESILDALPALIYCKNTEGLIVCVNEAFAAQFNMKKADFEGKRVKDLFPRIAGHLMRNDADIIETGTPQKRMFLFYETPDGERWAHTYKFPFRDTDGTIIGVIGYATDITEIKQMQDELKQSEQKYRNFFETALDCIYITALDGTILEFNDVALDIFGYTSKEEFRQVPVQHLYKNQEDRKRLQDQVARDGMANRFPVDLLRKDGSVVHALITVLPVKDADGRICGYQGTIHDVTELKEAEAQKNLLEAELRQAQKMEAVAKLSGGIAHDFNNLLFTIMGSIELAQSFTDTGQAKQLDRAYRACLEAKQLIRRFLELSERPPAAKSKGSIAEMIQHALSSRIDTSDRIHYELQIAGGLYRAAFVYDQMLQVMENLLSNAKNALVDGGTITVAAKNIELEKDLLDKGKPLAPGKYVKIDVSDTGVGIPADQIDKIFDPYFSTQKNPASKGQGLGLTTVYATINRHKGGITVDSTPEKGTTVTIYLPASEA
ncbi:MAG: PAS domain S-box protein [Desulfobacterales bacterium]